VTLNQRAQKRGRALRDPGSQLHRRLELGPARKPQLASDDKLRDREGHAGARIMRRRLADGRLKRGTLARTHLGHEASPPR